MRSDDAGKGFVLRGRHVLLAVAGFFLLVFTADAVFVLQALKTYPGEVSATPYEDGLAYNATLARREAQAQLGWRAATVTEPGRVQVVIQDDRGRPVRGLALEGHLRRPATDAGEHALAFGEVEPGVYEAKPGPMTGVWDLSVSASDRSGGRFEAERRLTWR